VNCIKTVGRLPLHRDITLLYPYSISIIINSLIRRVVNPGVYGRFTSENLAVAIWGTEDVGFRRQHHVVEVLREHSGSEEGHRPQRLRTDIHEVVPYPCRDDKNAAGTDEMSSTVFQEQLAGAPDDILRLLGGVRVPAEPSTMLDLVDDRR